MWFLTVDPFVRTPFSLQSFPSDETAGVFSRTSIVKNISNSLTYTVASSCVCTSPLPVLHLCSSGSSPAHPTGFRGAPRGEHLSTRSRLSVESPFNGPIRFPQHLFSVHDHGRQRSDRGPQHLFLPLRWPDCTLSRLRAEEYAQPVTQSIATLEPSSRTIPTPDRTLVARWSLDCVTTLGSRRSCPG